MKRFASKGVFPHQFAFTLLIPLRNIFLSPKQLIKRLDLNDNMTVLEVGPGPGYFSPEIAAKLPKGSLYLADIQQEMLAYAKKRIDKKGIRNVSYYLCSGEKFDFADNIFDRIFMVTVIGEVENKKEYMQEFHRILKPEGILSISELAGDPDKLSIDEVKNIAEGNGFTYYKLYGNNKNYTVNFIKH
ncbi:MAG TPA: methyltransferase domain-containing protein [Ignavibacteriaceae bacterium]|nr:methyltransferase domain-containing protein [Ignavibacteriaceae bacterium]